MRRDAVVIAAAVAVLVAAGGTGVAMVRSRFTADPVAGTTTDPGTGTDRGRAAPAPVGAAAAADTARKFLGFWARGKLADAAALTDDPTGAEAGLTDWTDGLQASAVTIRPGAIGPAGVRFTVSLRVGTAGAWRYASSLQVIGGSDGPLVRWAPAVLHPKLTDDTVLQVGQVPAGTAALVDRDGRKLARHPSLIGIVDKLASAQLGPSGHPGQAVQLADRVSGVARATLATLVPPTAAAPIPTTFDATIQDAAEKVTAPRPQSGLVVLQPSTGDILAIANAPATGTDRALLARLAPGSAMKVITATALLAAGVTPPQVVPCTNTITVNGKTFHNAEGIVSGGLTLTNDFARSCNTAFISLRDRIGDDALTRTARDVYGLTGWDIGLGETVEYGSVPVPPDVVTKAADMIGQGTVGMSPLAMASVAATVRTGTFTQPRLTPNAPRVPAARSLPAASATALRAMMRQVVLTGTASRTLGGLPGRVSAKTGTAETAGPDNGWIIGFRGDLAFGCLVEGGGHGADSCGPLVHDLLTRI
ncbi:MAG TPA: penicillin-binding transpeptidase domain-containing protein [Mycobacteriales bacterium]|nr:penicillin-binding transpeptidase domain-containing protein [Mycobacteriales bacterium]